MGLDYLQKKNWHPGSKRNREDVWVREQMQKEIMKKELERAKKLQEEKHNEELKKLQAEAGLIPKSHIERLEWMYEWGNKIQQKSNDEYLLGKSISVFEAEQIQAGVRERPPPPPIFKEEVTNAKCEDFSKIHEDPLFSIYVGEEKLKKSLLTNPLKVKAELERAKNNLVLGNDKEKQNKKIKKEKKEQKEKKQKNKEKKQKKHKKHSSSSSSSPSHDSKQKESKSKSNQSSTSLLYNQFIKNNNLSHLLVKDENGNLRPDFGAMKRRVKI